MRTGVPRAGPLFAGCALSLAAGCAAPAPEGVPVTEEPRHQLVSEIDAAQVLDVEIPGGDTTLYHIHARPIAYVCLQGSDIRTQVVGAEWADAATPCTTGSASSNPSYADSPITHRVANVGRGTFHLIAVQSLRDDPADGVAAGPGRTVVDNRWFRVQALDVSPEAPTGEHRHDVPTLVVLGAGNGASSQVAGGGETALLDPGAWTWIEAGQSHTLSSIERPGVRIVEVEVK